MQIVKKKSFDVLQKEQNESFADFLKNVLYYKEHADISAQNFCQEVSLAGVSITETQKIASAIFKDSIIVKKISNNTNSNSYKILNNSKEVV